MYETPHAQDFLKEKMDKVRNSDRTMAKPDAPMESAEFGQRESDYDDVRFFDDYVGKALGKEPKGVELDHQERRASVRINRPGEDYSNVTGAPKFMNMSRNEYDRMQRD